MTNDNCAGKCHRLYPPNWLVNKIIFYYETLFSFVSWGWTSGQRARLQSPTIRVQILPKIFFLKMFFEKSKINKRTPRGSTSFKLISFNRNSTYWNPSVLNRKIYFANMGFEVCPFGLLDVAISRLSNYSLYCGPPTYSYMF